MEPRRFITAFTNARHLSLSRATSIQICPHIPLPDYPSYYYSPIHICVLKLSLSLRFPQQNPGHTSPLPHSCYMSRPSNSSRYDHPQNICWAVQILKLLIMQFSPLPCHPRHPSQHPTPNTLPQCERSSFKPIKNSRQNYSSVYCNHYTPPGSIFNILHFTHEVGSYFSLDSQNKHRLLYYSQ
jgi:hypothetical protein